MEDVDSDRCLLFKDAEVGLRVIDSNNHIGIIKDSSDIHNVLVDYEDGYQGLYCLDPNCKENDPLFLYDLI